MSLKDKLSKIFKKEEPLTLVGVNPDILKRTQGLPQAEPKIIIRDPKSVETPVEKPKINLEIKPAPVLEKKPKTEKPVSKKEAKAVVEVIQEKIKKKEQRRLTYEEEVEKYEREQMQFLKGPAPGEQVGTADKSELRGVLWYKIMHSYVPWQVRNHTAKKNRVKFMITCGIFRYEFITMVKTREEGKKLMDDLSKGLDYDSVMEIIPLKYGSAEKIAIYARKRTEHQGRYSGTPLHPRLLERV